MGLQALPMAECVCDCNCLWGDKGDLQLASLRNKTCCGAQATGSEVCKRLHCPTAVVFCRLNKADMLSDEVPWHVAIFDEAHKLKNRDSQTYLACSELKTKLRYGLTGTAMQVIVSIA